MILKKRLTILKRSVLNGKMVFYTTFPFTEHFV